jgi:hypothetical protein
LGRRGGVEALLGLRNGLAECIDKRLRVGLFVGLGMPPFIQERGWGHTSVGRKNTLFLKKDNPAGGFQVLGPVPRIATPPSRFPDALLPISPRPATASGDNFSEIPDVYGDETPTDDPCVK